MNFIVTMLEDGGGGKAAGIIFRNLGLLSTSFITKGKLLTPSNPPKGTFKIITN